VEVCVVVVWWLGWRCVGVEVCVVVVWWWWCGGMGWIVVSSVDAVPAVFGFRRVADGRTSKYNRLQIIIITDESRAKA